MKKILLGLSVFAVTLLSAQNYPDAYPNNGWGNSGYYGDYDDEYYFPEDYYYQYPSDYYTNSFYDGYYNDYVRSINQINWNRFFATHRLAPWQIQQIIYLNQMYPSFAVWDQYYRYNPDRWYYDRFYALERILGPRIFIVFQNTYYGGYSPVVYYQNYRMKHYARNVFVIPRYRTIDPHFYRIDRKQYHTNNPRQTWGFEKDPRRSNTTRTGGFKDDVASGHNNGTRNGGIRNNSAADQNIIRTGGTRNPNQNTITPNLGNKPRLETNGTRMGGSRNDTGTRSGSIRNNAPERKIESNPSIRNNNESRIGTQQNTGRNSGTRLTSQ